MELLNGVNPTRIKEKYKVEDILRLNQVAKKLGLPCGSIDFLPGNGKSIIVLSEPLLRVPEMHTQSVRTILRLKEQWKPLEAYFSALLNRFIGINPLDAVKRAAVKGVVRQATNMSNQFHGLEIFLPQQVQIITPGTSIDYNQTTDYGVFRATVWVPPTNIPEGSNTIMQVAPTLSDTPTTISIFY